MRPALINRSALVAAGYKAHPHLPLGHEMADAFYQKCVRDGVVNLYFINAYVYEPRGAETSAGVMFEVRLFSDALTGDDEGCSGAFDLSLPWAGEVGVEKGEAFIARAYALLGCVPDRHNND